MEAWFIQSQGFMAWGLESCFLEAELRLLPKKIQQILLQRLGTQ